jgi:hypothetical protein
MTDHSNRNAPPRPQHIKKLTGPIGSGGSAGASSGQQKDGWSPPPLTRLEDTGLNALNVSDLVLKVLYLGGVLVGYEIAEIVKLPYTGVL